MTKNNTKKIEDLRTLVAILVIVVFGILFSEYLIFSEHVGRLEQIECALGIGDTEKCITRPAILFPPSGEVFEGHWKCIKNGTQIIYDKVLAIRDECIELGLNTFEKAGCKGVCQGYEVTGKGEGKLIKAIIDEDCHAIGRETKYCKSCIYAKDVPTKKETICVEWGWVK